ncbi:mechanosensitive ion channel family protein [Rothia sp. P6271]|uniref:mechanosensitive ion channel family protein n=1 Tax=unclassified Rothia (in: high G+C Gram-positive bacteria) TaxID=2689056 RepID=UPI003ACEA968
MMFSTRLFSLGWWDSIRSVDFWLGHPLRILFIIIFAIVLRSIVELLIRQLTQSLARGTRMRVIRTEQDKNMKVSLPTLRWEEDDSIVRSRQRQRAQTVGSVLRSVSSIVISAVALVMIIAELGFNIAPVIASAGVVGVALSFGAQSLVKDYLSGIFIVAEDQLGIGDWVDLGEASGTVESVGLRVTSVRDTSGVLWHVRNGEILRVGNSSQGWAQTNIDIPVPYAADVERLSTFLLSQVHTALSSSDVAESILGDLQFLGVESLSGEALTLRFSMKTAPGEQWRVGRLLRLELKKALDEYGAQIPLPQHSIVHSGSSSVQVPPVVENSAQK